MRNSTRAWLITLAFIACGLARVSPGTAAEVGVTQFREVQTDLEEAFMTVARADEERMKDERKT